MLRLLIALLFVVLPRIAVAQCVAGPDAEGRRALQTAFEAQSAVRDHLDVARLDRVSRDLLTERERGEVTAQATMTFGTSSVRGFSVCDELRWQQAKLANQVLSGAAGIGASGIARLELRGLGVSDSIVQRDLSTYYPDKEVGAQAAVPGAVGAGHGLWSARLEVLDEVSLTIGRVSSHSIRHSVGWDEETDEDGDTSIVKSHTHHWSSGVGGRTFVALGAPRVGGSDLIIGDHGLERLSLRSPWIVARPRRPVAVFQVEGAYDGLIDVPVLGFEVSPVAGLFANPQLPAFRLRASSEFTGAVLREVSAGARISKLYTDLGADLPGELWALDLQGGIYGGQRLDESGPVPGGVLRADLAVPLLVVLRLSTWAAINRQGTINAMPDAVGQPEWGVNLYVSYAR